MHDPRLDKLASTLINHSTKLQAGEHVLIEAFDIPSSMTVALLRAVEKAGGVPMVNVREKRRGARAAAIGNGRKHEAERRRGAAPDEAGSGLYRRARQPQHFGVVDVPGDKMKLYMQHWMHPVHLEQRVKKTRWCVLRFPTPSMAQQAQMSTEAFEEFFFDVCTMDYTKMQQACEPLKALMERTDRVRLVGPGTDLSFSIKDIGVIPCFGTHNIPTANVLRHRQRQRQRHYHLQRANHRTRRDTRKRALRNERTARSSRRVRPTPRS
jgi:aminopeptidase